MRRAAIAAIVAALAALTAGSAVAGWTASAAPGQPSDIDVRRNLAYKKVGSTELKLDAYIPSGGGTRPGVMVIYGGGWVLGSKELSAPLARAVAEQGFVAFAMDYRLAPFHPYPAAVEDVQASVAWVRDHALDFGLDPARIGSIGGSAGGHLSAMLATLGHGPRDQGSRIQAAASWAGPMDLHPEQFGPDAQVYVHAFLGCVDEPCDPATIDAASPIAHVDPSDAPILLAQGEEDELVLPQQAVNMANALEGAGVDHQLLLLPNAGHDERLIGPVQQPSFDFLHRQLGGTDPGSPTGIGIDDGGGLLAPTVAIVVAGFVAGTVILAFRHRRRMRY
ncbi:MAG TPA: alpha/beta hydrolase [Acidimicrobiia bacterium]|nr:alpha/beta hydrolase [Acidimicrobiia bacterium]